MSAQAAPAIGPVRRHGKAPRAAPLARLLVAPLLLAPASAMSLAPSREWRFNVTLDGAPIGYHRFALSDRGAERELLSEARFRVRILFIPAYRYVHDSAEVWNGDCLARIEARTDDNGERRIVRGATSNAGFVLANAAHDTRLDACVQTFAYWNPSILAATHLLNPQTGEYVPVQVTHLGSESLSLRGTVQASEHYRLTGRAAGGEGLLIDLWYSPHRDWLALESTTADGRRLRYQLQ
jgi:hypothetical protein